MAMHSVMLKVQQCKCCRQLSTVLIEGEGDNSFLKNTSNKRNNSTDWCIDGLWAAYAWYGSCSFPWKDLLVTWYPESVQVARHTSQSSEYTYPSGLRSRPLRYGSNTGRSTSSCRTRGNAPLLGQTPQNSDYLSLLLDHLVKSKEGGGGGKEEEGYMYSKTLVQQSLV